MKKTITVFSAIYISSFIAAIASDENPTIAAYNYPARIETQRPWNVFTEFSFNYWQPSQENMEVGELDKGTTESIATSGGKTTSIATSDSFKSIKMDFDFKPGFSIGVGYKFAHDAWDLFLKYTWFHNRNKKHETASNFVLFDANSENIAPTWGTPVETGENINFQFASEKWKLGMDIIDLDLGRWCYIGRKFTVHPILGARAVWIEQNVHVSYTNGFTSFTVDVPGLLGGGFLVANRKVHDTSHSWAVGPKIAVEMNWMLGYGFRLFGNGEVDLLFTRYSSIKEKSVTAGTVVGIIDFIPFNFELTDQTKGKDKKVDCLRTHLDLDLGFGWGTYLNKSKFYLDCAAEYTFQVFFDQNMFRHDVKDPNSFIPNGNLYIQGLTVTLSFDF